jgi:ribosomal protein L34E
VPEKDDTAARRASERASPRFRRPADEEIRRAARRLVRGGKASFHSQARFRSALLASLRRDEPLAVLSGRRLRRLLIDVPGVRISVRYTERPSSTALSACPVCGSELRPIRNQTLSGESIVLGQRCVRCDYWTHRTRRVPVRYQISSAGIDGRRLR